MYPIRENFEMIYFYIVRHGQTLLNQLDRAQGWADSPLTALGEQAARDLGKTLSSVMFQAAYTSDTIRAFDTAKLVLKESGQPAIEIFRDSRLREWCLGAMEAEKNSVFIQNVSTWLGGVHSFSEMNKRLPEVAEAIRQHDTTGLAESFEQISKRLKSFLVDAASSLPNDSNVLIVTHAFSMKTLIYLFDLEKIDQFSQINNAGSIRLLFDGQIFRIG